MRNVFVFIIVNCRFCSGIKSTRVVELVCLQGKMNCSPEDCGGVWGYAEMLEIIKQPQHEEYESYIEWLGDEFDAQHFDKDAVNQGLQDMRRFAKPE